MRKYCKSDFSRIVRVFTDDIVNMWSIDYVDTSGSDYKNFGDMPKVAQELVKYCHTNNDGIISKNGHTTSYRVKYN